VVLLDDMASTGHTLAQATRLLLQAGAASVDVAVTHALIDADALAALHAAGVGQFWSTDCVAHPTKFSKCVDFKGGAAATLSVL
jgi:ribose-phosphate pyrophosphokinase